MALTIYGSPRSRTLRVLWTAAELGLDYQHVPLEWDDPTLKRPDFLKLNPAGTIPLIVDNGFALAESLAINLYLAKTYGSGGEHPLYPTSPRGEAEASRWSLWAQGHLEPWLQGDAHLTRLREAAGGEMLALAERSLGLLDSVLAERSFLVDGRFTIADLNVCAVLSPSRAARLDLAPFPVVKDWLSACYDRPASRATRRRFAA